MNKNWAKKGKQNERTNTFFSGGVERKNVKILCFLGAGLSLRPLPSVTKKLIIFQRAEYYS